MANGHAKTGIRGVDGALAEKRPGSGRLSNRRAPTLVARDRKGPLLLIVGNKRPFPFSVRLRDNFGEPKLRDQKMAGADYCQFRPGRFAPPQRSCGRGSTVRAICQNGILFDLLLGKIKTRLQVQPRFNICLILKHLGLSSAYTCK